MSAWSSTSSLLNSKAVWATSATSPPISSPFAMPLPATLRPVRTKERKSPPKARPAIVTLGTPSAIASAPALTSAAARLSASPAACETPISLFNVTVSFLRRFRMTI